MAKRLPKEEKIKLIEDNSELKFVCGEINNFDTKFTVRCSCGEEFETTLRTIKNSDYKLKCETCRNEIARNRYKKDFDVIKKEYEENDCILLSNENDYKNRKSVLRFIAKCGHEHSSTYASFRISRHKLCKECSKELNKGENAYNWNGGYDSKSIAFRKTYEFKKWHGDVLKRDDYTCQICREKGKKLNVHHLDGYNWCVKKRTEEDNGITLCEKCHSEFHNLYGRGNNTKEQFKEFMYKIKLK